MIEVANARKERGLSQKKIEGLSGVKQPPYTQKPLLHRPPYTPEAGHKRQPRRDYKQNTVWESSKTARPAA